MVIKKMNILNYPVILKLYLRCMKLFLNATTYFDTSEPIDISIPLSNTDMNPTAWYVEKPSFEPVRTEHYIGSVSEGGSVNFRDIRFNPHGNGTHTECLGHITDEVFSINKILKEYFFRAKLITVNPKNSMNNDGTMDRIISPEMLPDQLSGNEALIIRTIPNDASKSTMHYSNTNPAYFDVECVSKIVANGIQHLLVDLPSVDRENDNGELAFHHKFWNVPENPNHVRTITELIFVSNDIVDGEYILSLQVAPFENDASPSRPILYKIKES